MNWARMRAVTERALSDQIDTLLECLKDELVDGKARMAFVIDLEAALDMQKALRAGNVYLDENAEES